MLSFPHFSVPRCWLSVIRLTSTISVRSHTSIERKRWQQIGSPLTPVPVCAHTFPHKRNNQTRKEFSGVSFMMTSLWTFLPSDGGAFAVVCFSVFTRLLSKLRWSTDCNSGPGDPGLRLGREICVYVMVRTSLHSRNHVLTHLTRGFAHNSSGGCDLLALQGEKVDLITR